MAAEKLLAEWFWTDRWMGSSAFLLPLEARGLYREMLTQAWRRGARLPNDHEAIQRAVGCTTKEWRRGWLLVEKYWRVDGDWLVNDTQVEIYAAAQALTEARSRAGKIGNEIRWGHRTATRSATRNGGRSDVANGSPPSPNSDLRSPGREEQEPPPSSARTTTETLAAPQDRHRSTIERTVTARSKRPIFSGQRLTVFEWMLDDLAKLLGSYVDAFDLHAWFFDLDAQAMAANMVIPQRDGGVWLQAQTLAEAQRRGLTIAVSEPLRNSLSARMAAMVAKSRTEA